MFQLFENIPPILTNMKNVAIPRVITLEEFKATIFSMGSFKCPRLNVSPSKFFHEL
jgi:hypothetical protein